MTQFQGVWCASLTPLDRDGHIHVDALAHHVRFLYSRGCHGVALFGSTGEAASFSVAERISALDGLLKHDVPAGRLIFGAGAASTSDAAELCRAAMNAGLAGVLLHPPYYYRQASDEGLFAFMDSLVQEVGNNSLRIMMYHFPRLIGSGFSEALIARLREDLGDIFVAIKDSSGDLARMKRLARTFPDLQVLAGTETLLLSLLRSGGSGCLTASANVTSSLARRVFDAAASPEADALQDELSLYRRALEAAPFVQGLKYLFRSQSGDSLWNGIRRPLLAFTDAEAERFDAAIAHASALPNFSV